MSIVMICAVLSGLAALSGFYRLLSGPTLTDRVVALDLLFAVAIVYCLLAAWVSQRTVYLDVAIGLALTGFMATLAWAQVIRGRSS